MILEISNEKLWNDWHTSRLTQLRSRYVHMQISKHMQILWLTCLRLRYACKCENACKFQDWHRADYDTYANFNTYVNSKISTPQIKMRVQLSKHVQIPRLTSLGLRYTCKFQTHANSKIDTPQIKVHMYISKRMQIQRLTSIRLRSACKFLMLNDQIQNS